MNKLAGIVSTPAEHVGTKKGGVRNGPLMSEQGHCKHFGTSLAVKVMGRNKRSLVWRMDLKHMVRIQQNNTNLNKRFEN